MENIELFRKDNKLKYSLRLIQNFNKKNFLIKGLKKLRNS